MPLFDVYPLYDVEPSKARGVYVYDQKGTKYLDLYGGHAVISIGHGHRTINECWENNSIGLGFTPMRFKILCKKNYLQRSIDSRVVPIMSCLCVVRAQRQMKMHLN